jgi:hypothetical protein
MKKLLILSMLMISSVYSKECPSVSDKINHLIKSHAHNVRGGEYCKFRRVYEQENIEIVLYTIEGPCYKNTRSPAGSCGNHYSRYMIAVTAGKEYEPIIIGGKGVFRDKGIDVSGDIITINGLAHHKGDPMCCPSEAAVHKYKIGKSAFEAINP